MKFIKKLIITVLILLVLAFALNIAIGCILPKDPVQKDIETIKTVVDMFEDKLTELGVDEEMVNDVIDKIEEYNKETKYVIAFSVQNKTAPAIKTTIHLPVDKEFFDSMEIGESVTEDDIANFEQFDQFIGDWIIVVSDKIVRE